VPRHAVSTWAVPPDSLRRRRWKPVAVALEVRRSRNWRMVTMSDWRRFRGWVLERPALEAMLAIVHHTSMQRGEVSRIYPIFREDL
jgi:hypothetical protein